MSCLSDPLSTLGYGVEKKVNMPRTVHCSIQ